jgi:Mor family transcriptional regulator
MNADTSFFNLLNKEAVDEEKDQRYSLTTDNIKSHISFKDRIGNFVSNAGATIVNFPVNMYSCTMDKFDWLMDKEKIDLSTNDKNLVASSDENLVSNMFSINPRQDSLQFRTSKAIFDLKVNDLYCTDAKYIDVADARIYPDSGHVMIHKKAKMDPLNNSKIIANRVTRFHTFLKTSTVIASRNSYSSRGEYPYYDADSNLTTISLESIGVDSVFHTVAYGKISEKDTFKLSRQFEFYGGVKISSPTPLLTFKGSTRIKHDCKKFSRSWMAFNSEIDPKNIQIPVGESMKTITNTNITAGVLWRDSPSTDSVKMYPTFLSPMISSNDPVVITASGLLQFDKESHEFQIASKEKLENRNVKGNYIALNTKACSLTGTGKVNLGMNYGPITIDAIGSVKYDTETGKTKLDITAKFNMPLDKSIVPIIAEKLTTEESLSPIDTANCNLFAALREWSDEKTANKIINTYREKGEMKKVPSEFESGFVITGLQLTSFENKKAQERGLVSTGDNAGVVNLNDNVVMKLMPVKAVFDQVYSENVTGDRFGLYLNAAVGKDYYFEFAMTKEEGDMKIFSEDEDFGNKINGLKADKRKSKNFIYEFTDNRVYISKFLRLFSTN